MQWRSQCPPHQTRRPRLLDDLDKRNGGGAEYGVTTLPGGKGALGGQNLAVVADRPPAHRKAAQQLITYLTSHDASACLYEGGFVPAREDALGDRCELDQEPRREESEQARRLRGQFEAALRAALEQARTRPATPYYAAVTRDLQETVYPGLRGQDAQWGAALRKLAGRLEESLKGR